MDNTLNSYEYLRKISDTYKDNNSLTGMLNAFRCISEDFGKFNSKTQEFSYSSYKFDECNKDEQELFINDQLQFIECLVTNSIYDKSGTIWNWFDIYKLLHNEAYALVEKINRRVVYSTQSNNRPIGDIAYQVWNGLQIIDLDIKDMELSNKLKPLIFEELKRFNWFLGVCKSASGKGLHIWTKITPISIEFKNRKIEYLCNFRHKYSYVYVVLDKYAMTLGYSKQKIYEYLDMAMSKPQQGIFISSDNALLNTNFKDLRLDVNFEGAFDCGVSSVDWIAHPDLKQIFSKLEWFNNDNFDKSNNIEVKDLSNLQDRDIKRATGPRHYKHAQRWQLANTLTNLFGEDEAFKVMCEICKETETRELRGDIKTAAIHNKPISVWAINELNSKHGFKIQVNITDEFKNKITQLDEEKKSLKDEDDPTRWLTDKCEKTLLHIKSNQFLSDIKEEIIDNLSHITLLEAGAGYGKTEMIKSLKAKTLLILPFTSTIKAKVEASSVTKDWLYYYGNKRPQTADLLGSHNMSMTIDKFSRLNIYELDQAGFEYIVIDESHLLFTSSYRDVMGPCIQRLANCKAKVIMMTGTPTGELLFFPNIKHIRVKKEDLRIKECELHFTPTVIEQKIEMCRSMAKDVMNGVKILFPTNNGMTFYEQITCLIQKFLDEAHYNHELKRFYYKKSNYGEETMDTININKSVGENDIVFCSTYLSVGVDICDKGKFSIYFDQPWIPQDIEQFANRIRNNDLYIKIFLPKEVNGVPINYQYTEPLNLGFEKKDLLFARDLIKTCNDMLERNEEEAKYSPLIQSLISANRYLKYDENDCRYYIDETTYKLKVFEERYSDFSKQLKVMCSGLNYYGYKIDTIDHTDRVDELREEEVEELLKACKHIRFNEVTNQTKEFLSTINDGNIDDYRELLRGNYELFKSTDPENTKRREDGKLYTNSIEILEKNVPIVLSLYKYYDCENIIDIYDFCTDKKTNKINFSKLERIRQFANIQSSIKKKRLDFPIHKFFTDCRKWAHDNPEVTKTDIEQYLAGWAAKYCNSVTDVVIDDTQYLETIYELITNLWRVFIIQTKPKNGIITLQAFELLWETKQQLNNIYGTMNTQVFFLEQLIDEHQELDEEEKEELPELPHTRKYKLEDIEGQLKDVVHNDFDYSIYSNIDGSNDRFLRKQENTNQLRETLFKKIDEEKSKENNNTESNLQLNLFESDELPF